MLKVLDVDGAVRRVKGGWEATGQPWTYDAERYARVAEAREREQHAMLDYLTPTGAGCASCGTSWTTRQPATADLRALRQLRRAELPADVSEGRRRGRRPAGPARRAHRAAEDVAHRALRARASTCPARSSSRPRRAAPSPGSPTSVTAPRCATLFRPRAPRRPVPVPLARAMVAMLPDWRPRSTASSGRVRDPARPGRRPRRRAVPLPAGAGPGPLGDHRPSVPAGGARTPPSGSPRCPGAARCASTTRTPWRARVLLVDDRS